MWINWHKVAAVVVFSTGVTGGIVLGRMALRKALSDLKAHER